MVPDAGKNCGEIVEDNQEAPETEVVNISAGLVTLSMKAARGGGTFARLRAVVLF